MLELLMVVAIIGILSAIVVPNLGEARKSSRDARRISDIQQLQLTISLYYNDKGRFPIKLEDLTAENYLSTLPKDPTTNALYFYNSYFAGTGPSILNCDPTSRPVVLYHLGAALETGHAELNNDSPIFQVFPESYRVTINSITYQRCANATLVTQFHEGSEACASLVQETERCYDVSSQL